MNSNDMSLVPLARSSSSAAATPANPLQSPTPTPTPKDIGSSGATSTTVLRKPRAQSRISQLWKKPSATVSNTSGDRSVSSASASTISSAVSAPLPPPAHQSQQEQHHPQRSTHQRSREVSISSMSTPPPQPAATSIQAPPPPPVATPPPPDPLPMAAYEDVVGVQQSSQEKEQQHDTPAVQADLATAISITHFDEDSTLTPQSTLPIFTPQTQIEEDTSNQTTSSSSNNHPQSSPPRGRSVTHSTDLQQQGSKQPTEPSSTASTPHVTASGGVSTKLGRTPHGSVVHNPPRITTSHHMDDRLGGSHNQQQQQQSGLRSIAKSQGGTTASARTPLMSRVHQHSPAASSPQSLLGGGAASSSPRNKTTPASSRSHSRRNSDCDESLTPTPAAAARSGNPSSAASPSSPSSPARKAPPARIPARSPKPQSVSDRSPSTSTASEISQQLRATHAASSTSRGALSPSPSSRLTATPTHRNNATSSSPRAPNASTSAAQPSSNPTPTTFSATTTPIRGGGRGKDNRSPSPAITEDEQHMGEENSEERRRGTVSPPTTHTRRRRTPTTSPSISDVLRSSHALRSTTPPVNRVHIPPPVALVQSEWVTAKLDLVFSVFSGARLLLGTPPPKATPASLPRKASPSPARRQRTDSTASKRSTTSTASSVTNVPPQQPEVHSHPPQPSGNHHASTAIIDQTLSDAVNVLGILRSSDSVSQQVLLKERQRDAAKQAQKAAKEAELRYRENEQLSSVTSELRAENGNLKLRIDQLEGELMKAVSRTKALGRDKKLAEENCEKMRVEHLEGGRKLSDAKHRLELAVASEETKAAELQGSKEQLQSMEKSLSSCKTTYEALRKEFIDYKKKLRENREAMQHVAIETEVFVDASAEEEAQQRALEQQRQEARLQLAQSQWEMAMRRQVSMAEEAETRQRLWMQESMVSQQSELFAMFSHFVKVDSGVVSPAKPKESPRQGKPAGSSGRSTPAAGTDSNKASAATPASSSTIKQRQLEQQLKVEREHHKEQLQSLQGQVDNAEALADERRDLCVDLKRQLDDLVVELAEFKDAEKRQVEGMSVGLQVGRSTLDGTMKNIVTQTEPVVVMVTSPTTTAADAKSRHDDFPEHPQQGMQNKARAPTVEDMELQQRCLAESLATVSTLEKKLQLMTARATRAEKQLLAEKRASDTGVILGTVNRSNSTPSMPSSGADPMRTIEEKDHLILTLQSDQEKLLAVIRMLKLQRDAKKPKVDKWTQLEGPFSPLKREPIMADRSVSPLGPSSPLHQRTAAKGTTPRQSHHNSFQQHQSTNASFDQLDVVQKNLLVLERALDMTDTPLAMDGRGSVSAAATSTPGGGAFLDFSGISGGVGVGGYPYQSDGTTHDDNTTNHFNHDGDAEYYSSAMPHSTPPPLPEHPDHAAQVGKERLRKGTLEELHSAHKSFLEQAQQSPKRPMEGFFMH